MRVIFPSDTFARKRVIFLSGALARKRVVLRSTTLTRKRRTFVPEAFCYSILCLRAQARHPRFPRIKL